MLVIRQMLRIRRINDFVICIRTETFNHVRAQIEVSDTSAHSSVWLSYVGRRADALALRADERRDKLRKAAVSCK